MKKLTGFAVVPTAEGKRIAYTYSELNDGGEVISTGNKGNFVAVDGELLSAIEKLEQAVEGRIGK